LSLDFSWIIPHIPTILSVVTLLVLAYNIKLSRDSLRLKHWVEMLQHSNLLIKLEGVTDLQISVTNVGEIPIDRMQMKIQGSIEKKAYSEFHKEYESKTILSPKDAFTIPLFKDLEQYLIDKKMLLIKYEEVPSGERDLMTDEDIFVKQRNKHIVTPFAMKFSLETTYTVHRATKKIPKEFQVFYDFIPEYGDLRQTSDPECRYSDNYEVKIEEVLWSS